MTKLDVNLTDSIRDLCARYGIIKNFIFSGSGDLEKSTVHNLSYLIENLEFVINEDLAAAKEIKRLAEEEINRRKA